MHPISLATLLIIKITVSSFTLQGNWSLISNPKVPQVGPSVTLQISDYVFKDQSVLQKLTFRGCNQMLIQSQFTQNQLFINPSTYYISDIPDNDCSKLSINPLDVIFKGLSNVFYFQIFIDILNFNDPFGKTVYSFKRKVQKKVVDISGVWSMNQYGNTRTALSVQISSTQITLCQGYSVYNYSFPSGRNTILLTQVVNSCPSQDLIQALNAVQYYRLNNGILDFYDKNVSLMIEMVYSSAYDSKKPIFTTPSPSTPPSVNTNTNSPSSIPKPPTVPTVPSTPIATPSVPKTPFGLSTNSGVSVSNLVGNWTISSLFGISFPKTNYYLLINGTFITLNGGCNIYTYQYTINSTTQLITIGNATQTNKSCGGSDDQLYVSGISKMYKYLVTTTSSGYSLMFYDQAGNAGYSLYSKIVNTPPASPQINTVNPFTGQALMLVLQRRDLARSIVTITNNTMTYTLCNTIKHTYTVSTPGKSTGSIKITGSASTNNTSCAKSNDQVYISALNSAVSYVYDSNANIIVFSSKQGSEVVTFNRV